MSGPPVRRGNGSGNRPGRLRQALRHHLDLACVGALTLVTGSLAFVPGVPVPVRAALGFAFLLLAPGYALAALMFPGRGAVDGTERLALSLGLSIITVPLLGWLLSATAWGIDLGPMSAALTGLTLSALLGAFYRRRRLAPGRRSFAAADLAGFGRAAGLVLLVGLAGASVVVAAQALRSPREATEFYLVGPGKSLEALPRTLTAGRPFSLTLGVHNRSGRTEVYRVRLPGALTATPEAAEVSPVDPYVLEVPVAQGRVWEETLTLEAPPGDGRTPLAFVLYRAGSSVPYRTLELFVTLSAAPTPGVTTSSLPTASVATPRSRR